MVTSLFAYFIVLVLLILLGAFYSGAETALFSLSRAQLANFKKSRHPSSKQLVQFLSKPRDLLVTILFGNEILNIAVSILIASFFYDILGPEHLEKSAFLSVSVATILILIFSEIIPKNVAILYAPTLAPFVIVLLKPLHWLLKPIRHIPVRFAEWIIARFGGEPQKESPLIVEEEFRYLVELGATTGQVQEEEKELIHKALDFEGKVVSQIMTPMHLVFSLSANMPYLDLLRQVKVTQFSRMPIYEEKPENIIGLLYVRDLFEFNRKWQQDPGLSIKEILRPPLFVSHHQRLEDLLQKLRGTKIHMAIVVNDSGKPSGIVTMHDVLEELFGEVEE